MGEVEESTEIRAFVRDHEALLSRTKVGGEYRLTDRFFVPDGKGLGEWDPAEVNMRLREFGERGNHIVYSTQTYDGKLKVGRKFYLIDGDVGFLEETLRNWGFRETFQIKRNHGYFIMVDGFDIALEDIEGLGWMVDVHIEPGQLGALKEALGLEEGDMLDESLPAYYVKNVLKE